MIVSAFNPETDELEKTYLSAPQDAADTVLAVKNNDRFAADDFVLIGEMGGEKSEIRTVASVNANKLAITTDALLFNHNSDSPVYKMEYDKIRFYRRTSEAGTPTLQTTVDIDVDNDEGLTRWDDAGALTTYWYQYAWYNSDTDAESELSDPVQATGYARKSVGAIIDGVARRVRDVGYSVLSFDEYLDIMNEVGDDLITQAQRPYTFLKKSATLDTVAGQNYIDLDEEVEDFWKFDYVEIDQNTTGADTNYKEVSPLSLEQFNQRYKNSALAGSDMVRDIAFDDETMRLYIHPKPSNARTGKVILHYYRMFPVLTGSGDLILTPNPTIYRYKLMAEYYSAKAEVDKQWVPLAQKYEEKYGNEVVKMQRVNRLDVGTPRSFRPPRAYRRRRYKL
jgi:hypothetical protein